MMENGKMINHMAKEFSSIQIKINLKEFLKTVVKRIKG